MSVNTAHVNNGVLIHSGEMIMLFTDDVNLDFSGSDNQAMKGNKTGRLFLTTHRMIFLNNKQNDALISFSFPFVTLHDVEVEQPVFGANYLKGKVRAQPNGNWVGEAKFKMIFKKGGCIDFAQAMMKAVAMASRNASGDVPPPYTPPTGPWYQAPPPAYTPNPGGYYGWVPPTHAFPDQPPANSVFMTDMPPPYPGINPSYTGYAPASGPTQPPPAGFAPPPMMNGGASGFTPNGLSSSEAKAAEAAQSAYYDPNKPQCAYVPPPAYYEPLQHIRRPTRRTSKQNVLECRVCEDVFTLQGDRVPRLLYCGHTVCHACLLRLPLKEATILCPFDRQPTPVEKLELTDKEATYTDKEVVRSTNEGWVGCDEDEAHTAVVYCIVCRSHLCEACSLATHATRTLAPHKRVPLSEKPHELPKCQVHSSHTAEFVCLKDECRAVAVCYLCKEYGRHKDHPHSFVEAEAEKLRTLLSAAVLRSHQLIDQMNQTERRLEEVVIGIGGRSDEGGTLDVARTRVEHHFEELRNKLDMQAAAARSAVETHARERLATLRTSQQDIATWLAQVMSVVVLCESSLGYDDAKLISCGNQLKKAIDSIEKQHDQFSQLSPDQFNPDIPITFTKDNRVHIGPKIEMRVVALGLDGAGKTSILFKLKQNEFMSCRSPTIGFNVEPIEYKNLRFNIWDIGGQPKLRPLWKHYFLNTQAVVFVVDSSDKDRLNEAALELAKLVAEKDLKEAALLILVNKQDVETSEGLEVVTEALGASKLCCGYSWHALACSAQTGQGLYQGLDWLSSQLVASPVTNYTSRESQSNED